MTAFAAVSLYIDGVTESDDYVCARKKTGKCNNCRLCRIHRIGAAQESRYMLFETLCGISSMMQTPDEIKIKPWNNFVHVLHTEGIDFCMKFKGHPYRTVTEAELRNSIDRGYPVIAFVKDAAVSPVCVLIDYDGDTVMMADPEGGVQNPPDRAPAYDEIEQMIIITGRGEPDPGLIDGFKNIESTLSDVLGRGIWDKYYQSFEFWSVLEKEPFEATAAAFERAKTLCWNFDRCHNFSEGLIDLIPKDQ